MIKNANVKIDYRHDINFSEMSIPLIVIIRITLCPGNIYLDGVYDYTNKCILDVR